MRRLFTILAFCAFSFSGIAQEDEAANYRAAAESVNEDLRSALAELAG